MMRDRPKFRCCLFSRLSDQFIIHAFACKCCFSFTGAQGGRRYGPDSDPSTLAGLPVFFQFQNGCHAQSAELETAPPAEFSKGTYPVIGPARDQDISEHLAGR
jgi:hypothetical protein